MGGNPCASFFKFKTPTCSLGLQTEKELFYEFWEMAGYLCYLQHTQRTYLHAHWKPHAERARLSRMLSGAHFTSQSWSRSIDIMTLSDAFYTCGQFHPCFGHFATVDSGVFACNPHQSPRNLYNWVSILLLMVAQQLFKHRNKLYLDVDGSIGAAVVVLCLCACSMSWKRLTSKVLVWWTSGDVSLQDV